MSTRLEDNRAILTRLALMVEAHPDGRFGQILANSGVVVTRNSQDGRPARPDHWAEDPWHDESALILRRMR